MREPVISTALVPLSAAIGATAGEWIKIAPRGRVETRDGRSFAFDPENLARRFNADATKVPVDFEHATVLLASKGIRADAIGWVEEMQARGDGLYGRVDWLDTGRAALTARTHRYVSPTFNHDPAGGALWLHSVALVTAPALSNMPALAAARTTSAGPTSEDDMALLDKLREVLKLPATATEEDVVAAISAMLAASRTTQTANEAVVALYAQLGQAQAALAAEVASNKVDNAIRNGKLTPGLRDWALTNLAANPNGFAAQLDAMPEALAHLFTETVTPQMQASLAAHRLSERRTSSDAEAIARQLGIPSSSLTGA